MSRIMIDPPVSPYAPREDIEAWVAELEGWKTAHEGDADALLDIQNAIELAQEWINWKDARKPTPEKQLGDAGVKNSA